MAFDEIFSKLRGAIRSAQMLQEVCSGETERTSLEEVQDKLLSVFAILQNVGREVPEQDLQRMGETVLRICEYLSMLEEKELLGIE